jgi:tryptophan halogenase
MSALYLQRALGASVRITVVESDRIGIIGVGESTFNTIKQFFDYVGLAEADWMPACGATFKLAILFENWTADGARFYHPFQRAPAANGVNLWEWWLKDRADAPPFDYACFDAPALCDHQRGPKFLDDRPFDAATSYIPYAYHFDATHLASYLREVAVARGVEHVGGEIRQVGLAADGGIGYLDLADGQRLQGDLYIDCTGFRGLLINQALGEPFQSFSESLLCDSAWAMRVPRASTEEKIPPYTRARAMSAGWIWEIPLFNRTGVGYVYCSRFLSRQAAEQELRAHVGAAGSGVDAFHVAMRIGRCRNAWVRNCIAIGLAAGFVEPLESTGIFFIQHALAELLNHFPTRDPDPATIASYNKAVGACIDGVRDFLIMHYVLSDRSDTPFWQAAREQAIVPNRLRESLELWSARLPTASTINPHYHGFAPYSYCVMLLGLQRYPTEPLPILAHIDPRVARETLTAIRERSDALVAALPPHADYLRQLYDRQEAAAGAARS